MNQYKSFTLIELLVVIVIIGVLAGVIMISTSSSINKADIAKGIAFSSTMNNELLSNLIAEYTFDEGPTISGDATNSDVKDLWGNYDGTVTGHAPDVLTGSNCLFGKCLDFNGTTDYIDLGTAFGNFRTNDFTVSVWVKMPKDAAYRAIFAKGVVNATDFLLYKPSSDNIVIYCDTGILNISTLAWQHNEWTYIVATRKSGIAKLYINGRYINQDTSASVDLNNTHNWNIGAAEDGTQRFFDGLIDEVRIYNAGLSLSQIKKEYAVGLNALLSNNTLSKKEYNERISDL